MLHRTVTVPEPYDLVGTLAPLRRGGTDPTTHLGAGVFWRATNTPDGPSAARYERDGDAVVVTAWGPGATWTLDAAPALLGIHDDPSRFVPRHDVIAEIHRRCAGLRQARTNAVAEAIVPSIIEQKVTGKEAWLSYARLVRAVGEPAPGPAGLIVPPDPATLAAMPYHAFHRFGIERRRAEAIRRVTARASWLQASVDLPIETAYRRMTSIDGIGLWTAAEVARVALGDPDAVSVGDYHLPTLVAYVLAGEPRGTDERMLQLLAPYAGVRARAIRYVEASGLGPPRRAPRRALRRIERI